MDAEPTPSVPLTPEEIVENERLAKAAKEAEESARASATGGPSGTETTPTPTEAVPAFTEADKQALIDKKAEKEQLVKDLEEKVAIANMEIDRLKDQVVNPFKHSLLNGLKDDQIIVLFGKKREELTLDDINQLVKLKGKGKEKNEDGKKLAFKEIPPEESREDAVCVFSNGFYIKLVNKKDLLDLYPKLRTEKPEVIIDHAEAEFCIVYPKGKTPAAEKKIIGYKKALEKATEKAEVNFQEKLKEEDNLTARDRIKRTKSVDAEIEKKEKELKELKESGAEKTRIDELEAEIRELEEKKTKSDTAEAEAKNKPATETPEQKAAREAREAASQKAKEEGKMTLERAAMEAVAEFDSQFTKEELAKIPSKERASAVLSIFRKKLLDSQGDRIKGIEQNSLIEKWQSFWEDLPTPVRIILSGVGIAASTAGALYLGDYFNTAVQGITYVGRRLGMSALVGLTIGAFQLFSKGKKTSEISVQTDPNSLEGGNLPPESKSKLAWIKWALAALGIGAAGFFGGTVVAIIALGGVAAREIIDYIFQKIRKDHEATIALRKQQLNELHKKAFVSEKGTASHEAEEDFMKFLIGVGNEQDGLVNDINRQEEKFNRAKYWKGFATGSIALAGGMATAFEYQEQHRFDGHGDGKPEASGPAQPEAPRVERIDGASVTVRPGDGLTQTIKHLMDTKGDDPSVTQGFRNQLSGISPARWSQIADQIGGFGKGGSIDMFPGDQVGFEDGKLVLLRDGHQFTLAQIDTDTGEVIAGDWREKLHGETFKHSGYDRVVYEDGRSGGDSGGAHTDTRPAPAPSVDITSTGEAPNLVPHGNDYPRFSPAVDNESVSDLFKPGKTFTTDELMAQKTLRDMYNKALEYQGGDFTKGLNKIPNTFEEYLRANPNAKVSDIKDMLYQRNVIGQNALLQVAEEIKAADLAKQLHDQAIEDAGRDYKRIVDDVFRGVFGKDGSLKLQWHGDNGVSNMTVGEFFGKAASDDLGHDQKHFLAIINEIKKELHDNKGFDIPKPDNAMKMGDYFRGVTIAARDHNFNPLEDPEIKAILAEHNKGSGDDMYK